MEKIFLIDFDDSFTLNIYSELLNKFSKNEIKIIPKKHISLDLHLLLERKDKLVVVLGPGPGHPKEYQAVLKIIPKLMKRENIFLMGVCLGHQLIWSALGAKVIMSENPKHGRSEKIVLNETFSKILEGLQEISVQRYNSLAVKMDIKKIPKQIHVFYSETNELMMAHCAQFVSYQFHPESVGTTCPKAFFGPMEQFLL